MIDTDKKGNVMQCPKCNENIKDGMRFCTKCGHDLNISVDNQPSVQAVPPVGEKVDIKKFSTDVNQPYEKVQPNVKNVANPIDNPAKTNVPPVNQYERYQGDPNNRQQTIMLDPQQMRGGAAAGGMGNGPIPPDFIRRGPDGRFFAPDGRVFTPCPDGKYSCSDGKLYILGPYGFVEFQGKGTNNNGKQKKTGLVVLIACLALLLVCGLGVGAYFMFFSGDGSTGSVSKTPTPAQETYPPVATEAPTPSAEPTSTPEVIESPVINIISYNDDIRTIIGEYLELHPDFDMEIRYEIESNESIYYKKIRSELTAATYDDQVSTDIFVVDLDQSYDFVNGDYSNYVLSYNDLGIDVSRLINEASIAKYAVDLGTRHTDGEIVGLGYESTCAMLFYKRAFFEKTKGDIGVGPSDSWGIGGVFGAAQGNYNDFTFARMTKLLKYAKRYDYKIVANMEGMWKGINNHSKDPWISQGRLQINDQRQSFLDVAKDFYSYTSKKKDDAFDEKVVAYFGNARFLRNVLNYNSNYGEWGVCSSPVGYYDGGEMIMINENADSRKIDAIKDIIEWITLDGTDEGFQYKLASGNSALTGYQNTIVLSEKVDALLVGASANRFDCIGEMDILDSSIAIPGMQITSGNIQGPGYKEISNKWYELCVQYAAGEIGKNQVRSQFEDYVDSLGIK